MSVLIVSTNDWASWGGSEELWYAIAKLRSSKGQATDVCVKWYGIEVPQVASLRKNGCNIIYRGSRSPPMRAVQRIFFNNHALRLQRLVRRYALVVISQGSNFDGEAWMSACIETGTRYVVIAQAAAEQWWQRDEISEALARGYSFARCAYFVSIANKALTEKQFGVRLSNTSIVRNPINVPYDVELPWPESSQVRLACVGRVEPMAKGQDLILEVLGRRAWRERNISLSIFGRGNCSKSLSRFAENLNLRNVKFCGHVDDIASVWRHHHALILPSRYEGLPLAVVEAMFCGRPVIVTDVAGNREVMEDGVTGFLAPAPTADFLDLAMERAWARRSELEAIGRAAAVKIRELVPRDAQRRFADEIEMLAAGG